MKRYLGFFKLFGIFAQIFLLIFSPLFVVAADPVVGARLITPADRREGYVAYMKSQSPQLKITFNKTSFREGDEVTAQAMATGFKEDQDELYYTWYLRRSGCDLDSGKSECDNDGDGKVTENDWKIEAARILAKNGFEKNDANYNSASGDDDGYKATPSIGSEWEMPYKSKNDTDVDENCYIQDFKTGRFYELRETEEIFNCSAGGSVKCGKEEQVNCSGELKEICAQSDDQKCKVENEEDLENFKAEVKCPQDDTLPEGEQKSAVCGVPGKTLFNFVKGDLSSSVAICSVLAGDEDAGEKCSSLSSSKPSCTFKKSNNLCKHLFPTQVSPKELSGNSIKTGDGEFDVKEEEFWGTDPQNKSTAGNGKTDEANVLGLGAKTFTWTYINGDQIGLAVEGDSANVTKHDDNSYMRTWVFSKNKCDELSDDIEDVRAFYVEYQEVPDVNAGILTADFDLDKCLKENLIDPTGGGIGTLQVNLVASPENAVNDPSETGRGDIVRAQATVGGADDLRSLYYEWKIEASSKGSSIPNDETWIDITDKVSQKSIMQGFDIKEIKFPLNIPRSSFPQPDSAAQYIRVKLKVSENAASENRIGRGTVVIKAMQLDKDIVPYLVSASSEGKLSLDKNSPICQSDEEISQCPITENRIIGVTVPNNDSKLTGFTWKINGATVSCDQNISSECDGVENETVFFPASGTTGDEFEVVASAKDVDTGLVKTITKKFKIVKPMMRIVSANKELAWPRQLGSYKSVNGNSYADYSDRLLETNMGNAVQLKAEFTPEWIKNYADYSWEVNGEKQGEFENKDLEFQVIQPAGTTYNIGLDASYLMASSDEQVANVRSALSKTWGISPQNTTEESIDSSIQIEVVAGAEEIANKKSDNIFASMVSNLPMELMFLLRLALTVGVLILVTGVVFTVSTDFGKTSARVD